MNEELLNLTDEEIGMIIKYRLQIFKKETHTQD